MLNFWMDGTFCIASVSTMMIEKIIVVAPTTAVPISTGFAVALKVFPAPSFSSSSSFASSKLASTLKSRFQFRLDVGQGFDEAEFINALRVVGDGPVGIDGDGDRSHAEKTNATRPNANTATAGWVAFSSSRATPWSTPPRLENRYPTAIRAAMTPRARTGEVTGNQPLSTSARAPSRWRPQFSHVPAVYAGEDLGEFGMSAPAKVPQLMIVDNFHQGCITQVFDHHIRRDIV